MYKGHNPKDNLYILLCKNVTPKMIGKYVNKNVSTVLSLYILASERVNELIRKLPLADIKKIQTKIANIKKYQSNIKD